MAGRGDKVEESVDSIVTEAWVTLDARLFSKDIIILALNVSSDLSKSEVNHKHQYNIDEVRHIIVSATHVNSLSMLSPNPGVSTIVKEIRTPSSSSSVK
jgi:hypothetical protein